MYDAARIVGEQVRTVADMDQPNLNKHNTDIIRFGLGRLGRKGAFEEHRSSRGGDMSASTILTRLKRTHYDISPEEYWDKWRLPSDYPMVAPAMPPRVRIWPKAMRLGNEVLDLTARQRAG